MEHLIGGLEGVSLHVALVEAVFAVTAQDCHPLRLGKTLGAVGLGLGTGLLLLGKLGQPDSVQAKASHFHAVSGGVDLILPHHYSLFLRQALFRTTRPIHYLVSDVLSVCGNLNVLLSPLANDLLDLVLGQPTLFQITLPRRYLVLQPV